MTAKQTKKRKTTIVEKNTDEESKMIFNHIHHFQSNFVTSHRSSAKKTYSMNKQGPLLCCFPPFISKEFTVTVIELKNDAHFGHITSKRCDYKTLFI